MDFFVWRLVFLIAHRAVRKPGDVQQRKARGNTFLDVCTAGGVATHALSCSMCAALTARYASERLPLICHVDVFAGGLIPDIRLSSRAERRRLSSRAHHRRRQENARRRASALTTACESQPWAADIPFSRTTADATSCISSRGLKLCRCGRELCFYLVRTFQGARYHVQTLPARFPGESRRSVSPPS